MSYKCKYGLYHDKPCKNGEPSSNNGFIYSAFGAKLGLMNPGKFDDWANLKNTFKMCVEHLQDGLILINRLPGKKTPPISHDEIIGMYCLGLLPYRYLKKNHFMFRGAGEPMNVKTVKKIMEGIAQLALWTILKGKHHRNTFWEKKIEKLSLAAYRLHPGHIYFLKKCEGIKPHSEEKIIFDLYIECTLKNGTPGEKNLLWLQAMHMKNYKLAKRCNHKSNFKKYFPKDHPFNA